MYYCNKQTKIIHRMNCAYSKKMKDHSLMKEKDIRSLLSRGYRFCEHCASIKTALGKEKAEIDACCKSKKMVYCITDGHLVVKTPFGIWRILPACDPSGYDLWHQNGKATQKAQGIAHYHLQKRSCKHLLPIFRYIETHDMYREQVPFGMRAPKINPNLRKGSKRYKKQQKQIAKYIAKRDRINHVQTVWFLLEQISKARKAG